MGKVEDFLETIPSKHTRKNYVNGLKKFEAWYGDSITKLIKNPDATKTVEKFYVALKQKHPQNTCRNLTNAPIQFLKYFGTDVKPRKALGIYRTEVSTDDHKLTIEEVQRMASVADLKEQVMLEVLLLGLRIGDAITLKVSDLNKLEQEAPVELKLKAAKEGTIYETFISQEFKELLQLYLPTINGEWLFQGIRKGSHAKDETLNTALKNLAKRACIQLHGRLHWHCGRKLVMRTGAELGISPWIIKRFVGKSIPRSDDTYLSDMDLKEGFLMLSSVLKLKPKTVNGKVSSLEEDGRLFAEALWELVKPIVEKKRLEKLTQRAQGGRVDLMEMEPMPTDPREGLKLFLKMRREVEQ
jgi:integrase